MTLSTDWPESWGAPPLFATARNPRLRSDGPLVSVIADTLGTPFIPWQRHTSEVANERRPDGSYEYQIVVVSVPRQTGKTTLIRAEGTHRCLVCGRDVFYTAQTGKDARARWMDLVKALRLNEALRPPTTKVALRGGSEHVEFPGGSVFQVFAPTPESLHGYTPPTVMLDEVFSLTPAEGELLMGAIGPAQITIRDKQIWIVSTAGTAESTFLHDWIDRAMEGMPRVAGFIWGATDDMDPTSLDDIARFHPGVGFELNGKVLEATDVLEQLDRNTRAEYERAYANRRTLTASHLIPAETWRPLGPEKDQEPPALPDGLVGCVVTYDVGLDRRTAGILATWLDDDGIPTTRVVAAAPGVSWLAGAIDQLDREHKPAAIVAAGHGPVLEVTEDLRDRGVEVDEVAEREFATACGNFLTLIEAAGLRHDGTEQLERSVCGLVTRTGVVDGVAFSRRHSAGDSSLGIAAALGTWRTQRHDDGIPSIQFG